MKSESQLKKDTEERKIIRILTILFIIDIILLLSFLYFVYYLGIINAGFFNVIILLCIYLAIGIEINYFIFTI